MTLSKRILLVVCAFALGAFAQDAAVSSYLDPKMIFQTFGGEGTGVKSITYAYPWTPGYWNVLADRAWDVGNKTYTAFFVKDGKTGVWRHLITMNIPIAHERYSVNAIDFTTRSINKKTNWEGGKASDSTGEYFFMGAGGSISSTNNAGTVLTIARTAKSPQEEYGTSRIVRVSSSINPDKSKVIIEWAIDSLSVPQFSSRISIQDGMAVVATSMDTMPQRRQDTLDISKLTLDTKKYSFTLSVTDMFDGQSFLFWWGRQRTNETYECVRPEFKC